MSNRNTVFHPERRCAKVVGAFQTSAKPIIAGRPDEDVLA
jgi:hypothetical protein